MYFGSDRIRFRCKLKIILFSPILSDVYSLTVLMSRLNLSCDQSANLLTLFTVWYVVVIFC